MRPVTEAEIRNSLINMADDEIEAMSIPGLHETIWGEREFLGWRDVQHSRRGYLVFWAGDQLRGIMVRAAETPMPPGRSALCALCHTQQPAPQVSLFVAPKAGEQGLRGNTVGTYLCADLSCSTIIRMAPVASSEQVAPGNPLPRRAEGIVARLEGFSNRVLCVDAA